MIGTSQVVEPRSSWSGDHTRKMVMRAVWLVYVLSGERVCSVRQDGKGMVVPNHMDGWAFSFSSEENCFRCWGLLFVAGGVSTC
jgi:hypothetical protein